MAAIEPNLILDALIDEAGLSRAGLATRINAFGPFQYDHASVARWIRDHAIPRHPVPLLICRVLGQRLGKPLVPADLGMDRAAAAANQQPAWRRTLHQAMALWRSDATRPDFTATSTRTSLDPVAGVWQWQTPPLGRDLSHLGRRRIDPFDVQHLRRAREHYQQMYRRIGGVLLRPRIAVVLHTEASVLLRESYDNDLGRQLYRAIGGLAVLAGICAYDTDFLPLANRYLDQALRLATASDDRAFGAYVLAVMATGALHARDHLLTTQYAQAALRSNATLTPALAADLHTLAAKAYARMRDTAGCHEHMRQAERHAARIDHAVEPAETSYVQPGLVECQHAEALRRLGDLPAALPYAEASIHDLERVHLRGRVHRLAGMSLILTAQRDLDRSVDVAHQVLDHAEGMESGRIRDRVDSVIGALRPYAAEPVVAEFLIRATGHERGHRHAVEGWRGTHALP